jgi:hypothetical protein
MQERCPVPQVRVRSLDANLGEANRGTLAWARLAREPDSAGSGKPTWSGVRGLSSSRAQKQKKEKRLLAAWLEVQRCLRLHLLDRPQRLIQVIDQIFHIFNPH